MTSERAIAGVLAALLLGGCTQATVTEGLHAEAGASNVKSARNGDWAGDPVADGESSYQRFYTDDGKRIDLQQGLVVVAPVGLRACASAARAGRWLLDFVVPSADAHVAHDSAPAGVIDVALADGTTWDLGEAGVAPGTYCSVELALETLPAGPGAGALLFVAPCYYPDSGAATVSPGQVFYPDEVNHRCYDAVPIPGAAQTFVLDLPEAVTLDASSRSVGLALAIAYDTWFDGIDVDALGCDPAADPAPGAPACDPAAKRAQYDALVENVKASIALSIVDAAQ